MQLDKHSGPTYIILGDALRTKVIQKDQISFVATSPQHEKNAPFEFNLIYVSILGTHIKNLLFLSSLEAESTQRQL